MGSDARHTPDAGPMELTGSDLPRSYEEIFKRSLDHRGRPVKSLELPDLRARARARSSNDQGRG